MSSEKSSKEDRAQLSVAGVVIGCIGCVIITASSVYTALKMGALPWPTIFTSIAALVILRALGHRSLNEANVTQIIMSAGSMVAGGLSFTIPGIWMLGLADEVSWQEMILVALAGTCMGLVATALIRRRFIEESQLEFPIGVAAAETLKATTDRSHTGKRLFGSMGFAGLYCVARDVFGWIPTMLFSLPISGVSFGIYNSPMMISLGFLVGGSAIAFWFAGAVFSNFGLIVAGSYAGLWTVDAASGIVSSLGMGLMMGSGLGVVLRDIVPELIRAMKDMYRTRQKRNNSQEKSTRFTRDAGLLALFVAVSALIICVGLGLGPVPAVVVVALSFVTTIMSAQSVGQTGIDPMEIFGLIVLLAVAALADVDAVQLFFVAAIVAVTCGLAGDVMSDFKTGALIGTSPRSMWIGQTIGALLGVVVAVATMCALVSAYGTEAFGPGELFVSAQASVVATMVSGIPSVPAFAIGLICGIALYFARLPSMMFGLGVYLPFYMSLSGSLGALIKLGVDTWAKRAGRDMTLQQESDTVIASGLLGGESIVGVIIALASVIAGFSG